LPSTFGFLCLQRTCFSKTGTEMGGPDKMVMLTCHGHGRKLRSRLGFLLLLGEHDGGLFCPQDLGVFLTDETILADTIKRRRSANVARGKHLLVDHTTRAWSPDKHFCRFEGRRCSCRAFIPASPILRCVTCNDQTQEKDRVTESKEISRSKDSLNSLNIHPSL
jgi:hypothetical protein